MTRAIKWITMVAAGIVLLLVLAAVLLPKLIDPSHYRADISKLVYEQTGLTLKINGAISWSLFPWLGLSIETLSINGMQNNKLADLDSVEISIKLLPLLRKKIELQTARLIGLDLNLVRHNDGTGNWEVNTPKKPPTNQHTTVKDTSSDKTKKTSSMTLDITNIEISELNIRYNDQQSDNTYLINHASLVTGGIADQKPFDLNLSGIVSSKKQDLDLKINMSAKLTINLKDAVHSIDNLALIVQPYIANSEQVSLKGNLNIQQQPLLVKGQLSTSSFNPHNLLTQIRIPPPLMADTKAFQSLSVESNFESDGKSITINKLDLTLDDFNINGFLKIANNDKKTTSFEFVGNNLNLDTYLPAKSTNTAQTKTENSDKKRAQQPVTAKKEQPLIPENLLKELNINGSVRLSSLIIQKMKFEQPSITLTAADGRSRIKLKSEFYHGSINMDNEVDVSTRGMPTLSSSATLQSVNLQAMAESIPQLKAVHGAANAKIKLNTQGQLQSILTKNLNGTISFSIDHGVFAEANFDKMVCEGIAKIRKKTLQTKEWGKSTKFQNLKGSFIIQNGVARNKDLTAALSNMNLKGDGNINLVNQTIDYHIGLNIRGDDAPDSDPACQINADYIDVTWPIRCQGKIGEQTCGIDSDRLAGTITSLATKEIQKRLQDEVNKKAGPLKDILKGFFK
ncbi:MAG: AsmA family protein [Candidatus Endonucleobacter sp. (ex Gigantidas childressi)]|nr:AsmA family protein [Candidatus Endonucleobacter sp. (ex Gigantidas childressi)]